MENGPVRKIRTLNSLLLKEAPEYRQQFFRRGSDKNIQWYRPEKFNHTAVSEAGFTIQPAIGAPFYIHAI